jgi:hypothetical protein
MLVRSYRFTGASPPLLEMNYLCWDSAPMLAMSYKIIGAAPPVHEMCYKLLGQHPLCLRAATKFTGAAPPMHVMSYQYARDELPVCSR